MFWFALAAQLTAPQPVKPFTWWSLDDVPASLKNSGGTRQVLTRTTVQPDAHIVRCEVEVSSGDPKVDAVTCALIVKRGKFEPARDARGKRIYGVFRQTITWAVIPLGDRPDDKPLADLELTVHRLPKGVKSPATVRVMFGVDEQGRPYDCAAEAMPSTPKANWQLAPLACKQLLSSYTARPAVDEKGLVIRSIQDAVVRFKTQD